MMEFQLMMITCMMNIGCYFETLSCTGFPMSMFVLMMFDVVDTMNLMHNLAAVKP